MKEYTIYTKWLAYELRKQGHKFIRAEINPHFPQFYCYVFEDNADLQSAISYFTKIKKRNR